MDLNPIRDAVMDLLARLLLVPIWAMGVYAGVRIVKACMELREGRR